MTIALLCPTRARPEQFIRMHKSAFATSGVKQWSPSEKVVIYAACDKSEWDRYAWSADECNIAFMPDGMPTAHKWNLLAEQALENKNHKLFMLCADDVVFSTPCWDTALIDHYNALENKIHVYHLRDSRSEDGTPHPIVTREWIEAMGYFLPPIFTHWFVDTWTVEIAKHCGCYTHMKDYLLLHDKPSDRGQADETHSRIRQWGWNERDRWVHEHCQHFLEFEKRRLIAHFSQSARAVA